MPPESPFREEDLSLRVDALRIERDNLTNALAVTRTVLATCPTWSWSRFVLGFCVLPGVALLLVGLAVLFHR
jgi:hypothetical protein